MSPLAAQSRLSSSAASARSAEDARLGCPHVLFIMGEGRSGSTLLARLFGTLPGFVNVGELRYIWRRGMLEGQLCGCGAPLPECGFWRSVIERAFPGFGPEQLDRLARVQEAIDRPDRFLKTRGPEVAGLTVDEARGEYESNLHCLFAAIRDASQGAIVVDSSKTPAYGRFLVDLAQTGRIRLSLVHLVRDCRAVSFSKGRKKLWKTADESQVRYLEGRPLRNAARWTITNFHCSRLRSAVSESVLMRYEDLVADPNQTLKDCLVGIGLADRAPQVAFVNGETRLGLSCTVSGNPDRFDAGPLNIRLDDEWRTKLPWWKNAAATCLGLPYLLRFRYLG